MASGWNLWVWLVGVVVRRYIDILIIIITFPYSICISSFLQQHPYFIVHFKKNISFLFMLFLCNRANVAQRTFKIIQKSRSHRHADIIISTKTCMCVNYESLDFRVQSIE